MGRRNGVPRSHRGTMGAHRSRCTDRLLRERCAMPRRWMAAGRRLWADPRGVEAVEAVALVGLFIALALAVLVVFNAQGGRLGGAAIA